MTRRALRPSRPCQRRSRPGRACRDNPSVPEAVDPSPRQPVPCEAWRDATSDERHEERRDAKRETDTEAIESSKLRRSVIHEDWQGRNSERRTAIGALRTLRPATISRQIDAASTTGNARSRIAADSGSGSKKSADAPKEPKCDQNCEWSAAQRQAASPVRDGRQDEARYHRAKITEDHLVRVPGEAREAGRPAYARNRQAARAERRAPHRLSRAGRRAGSRSSERPAHC